MPDEVLATLDLTEGEWSVVTQAVVERQRIGPDGATMNLADSVLRMRRNGSSARPG